MGCIAKNGKTIRDKVEDMGFDDDVIDDDDVIEEEMGDKDGKSNTDKD